MQENNNRNTTEWIIANSIKWYKTEIVVLLLSPYETKETFRTTYCLLCFMIFYNGRSKLLTNCSKTFSITNDTLTLFFICTMCTKNTLHIFTAYNITHYTVA